MEFKNKHCCYWMGYFLEEGSVHIFYDKEFKRYSIGMKNGTDSVQTMNFCPWCGSKLPENLKDLWFEILEKEYGLQPNILEIDSNKDIPEEFKTDEWWKKRGL